MTGRPRGPGGVSRCRRTAEADREGVCRASEGSGIATIVIIVLSLCKCASSVFDFETIAGHRVVGVCWWQAARQYGSTSADRELGSDAGDVIS